MAATSYIAAARGEGKAARSRTVESGPRFTASFGVIDATDREDLSQLLVRADTALFEAKRLGRDCVVVHDEGGRAVECEPDVDERGPTSAVSPAAPREPTVARRGG